MIRDVTDAVDRSELRRISRRTSDGGELAEEIVVAAFDLDGIDGDQLQGDAINARTGARYEIKSARDSVGSGTGSTEPGRFRLWEDQHRSIVGYDAAPDAGAGWYVFVRSDRDGTPVEMRRVEPSTVTQLVGGRWYGADHAERDARQYKLPIAEVFDV